MAEALSNELPNEQVEPEVVLRPEAETDQPNARKTEANRRNARGAMNALKHGRYAGKHSSYAQSLSASMIELGENPREFSRMHEALLEAFQPTAASQTMLVDDIAMLRWERRRLERAHAALLARRIQELEIERQRMSLQVTQKISVQIPASQLKMDLIWDVDSPTKFQKLLQWLNDLKLRLDLKEFTDIDVVLDWIYGPNPTTRGAMIKVMFYELAEAKRNPDPAHCRTLGRELEAEIPNVMQEYHLYIRKYVEVTSTMREECLAPTADQRWLMRELNTIDRQIERKTRLLLL